MTFLTVTSLGLFYYIHLTVNTIYIRHMRDDHRVAAYDRSHDRWIACVPCRVLTTNIESHNHTRHLCLSTDPHSEPGDDDLVTVRLLLPHQTTLIRKFRSGDTVSAVLAAHSEQIRAEEGDLGPEEELTVVCREIQLLPGQFHTTSLSSLDYWNWAGEKEIHLE